MISCTEFIPAYSTLFTYLEEKFGPAEVPKYWGLHFDPKQSALYKFVQKEGIKGCFTYWTGTLNEEAADFTMYLNEKRGYYLLDMHHCPSKGRLLKLKDEIGVEPYHGYCLHCDHYRAAIEACGLCYIFNCVGADKASCSIMIYDPKVFGGQLIVDNDTQIMDRRASDNEYFHRAFHGSLNKGIEYLAETYGEADVEAYLSKFAHAFYWPIAKAAKERGLVAIEEKIMDTYKNEHALDAVQTQLTEDALYVTVSYCPAEKFLRSVGVTVTPLYYKSTEVVMRTLAKNSGFKFSFDSYDPATGAAKYHFTK